MAKKFSIIQTENQTPAKKFQPPKPGITTKPTVIIGKEVVGRLKKQFIVTGTEPEDQPLKRSKLLNTPVYTNIEFDGNQYTDENGNEIVFQFLSIDLVIMSVMNEKNIVTTTIQGRNGTVKEYLSDGDFQIKIEGKIYGSGANNYPIEEVQKLIEICKAPQAIVVNSDFLKMFDVSSIVIKSYDIPQEEGVRNYQSFTLTCLSDRELILLKNA